MPTYGKLNLLLINNILVFFSRNTKKTHTDQIILQIFLLCLKRKNVLQGSCKKVFPKCMLLIQLASRNGFYSIWYLEEITFYTNLLLPRSISQPPCCCVLWNKRFERSPYFMSVISIITLDCWWYQRFKLKLLHPNYF